MEDREMFDDKDEKWRPWRLALGAQLAAERTRLKLNQTEMAARMGVHQRTISNLERGINPNINNYLSYAEVVDVSIVAIFARAALALSSEGDPDSALIGALTRRA